MLLQFLARRKMEKIGRAGKGKWHIRNNGDIEFPYREAQKMFSISDTTYTRAIDELIAKGFICISVHGDGTGGGHRTKYELEDRWQKYEKTDFVKKKRKKATRRLGFMSKKSTDKPDGKTTDISAGTMQKGVNSPSSNMPVT